MLEFEVAGTSVAKLGRNAKENTELVRLAKQWYIWFHLERSPSGHLILETEEPIELQKLQKETIIICGRIVKEYSKFSGLKKVKVIYTTISNLKLGEMPGEVFIKSKNKIKTIII